MKMNKNTQAHHIIGKELKEKKGLEKKKKRKKMKLRKPKTPE